MASDFAMLLDSADPSIYELRTHGAGPQGSLPLTPQMLREAPSGDIFGMTQDVGMGWKPEELNGQEFLILSTQGGIRAPDGAPIALGYHTGHWEVGLLMQAAAEEIRKLRGVPFAGFVTDFKYTDVQATLQSPIINEFARARAPIPSIGGIGRYYIVPNLSITGELTMIAIPDSVSEDFDAHYKDLDIYGTFNFTNNVGAQFGYRSFDLGYLVDDDTGSFELEALREKVPVRSWDPDQI